LTTELQKFTGHSKKVGLLNFSPTVAEVIATGGFDNTVNVWNICNGTSYSKVSLNDNLYSLDWNHNGSLLGVTTKGKVVNVIDPRGNKVEMECHAHDSGKTQKVTFLDQNFLMTSGFSKSNERQIKLFDMRKFTESVQVVPVDTQLGIMIPFFDPDMGMIYVPGRGEGNVKFFEYNSGNIKLASEYRGTTQQKGMAFFPKRAMNYNKCEVGRFAKLTVNTIEYLSFHVPKRNEGYDSSIYPDCLSGEASLTVEEWLKGENKDPVRKNITTLENKFNVSVEMSFEKRESVIHEEKKSNNENSDLLTKVNIIIIFIINFNFYFSFLF
jgi:hypothetical protein